MLPRQINIEHAKAFASANGMTLLAEVKDAVVVKLKNGSISNISAKTISDFINQNQQTVAQQNTQSNIHSASTNDINEVIDNHSAKKLFSIGVTSDIKSSAQLTDQMKVNAMSAGISANELTNLLSTRNVQAAKTEQDEYFSNQRQAIQNAKQGSSHSDMRDRQAQGVQDTLRAGHGLSKQKVDSGLNREVSQQINAGNI